MAKGKNKGGQKKSSQGGVKGRKPPPSCSSSNANNNNGKKGGRPQRNCNKNKNKWSYDDDDDDTTFRNTLLNQGNTIKEMTGDGSCLFRSLSDQLYDDSGSKHDVVRHDVCNHLSENKEEFQYFLLMDEDDEDVLDIDEYISKMREDGEWGGNVEVVVASRVYKRNIIVFSGEYSNGALHITCDDKEEGSDDLLLSYHGNDHYNSVHPNDGQKQQMIKPKGDSSTSSTTTTNRKKKKEGGAQNDEIDNNVAAEDTTSQSQSTTTTRTRPPTRGSTCPCGSGLKYKKCCMSIEKSKKRLAKHMEKHGAAEDGKNTYDDEDEKKEDAFIGDFRVLTI